MAGVTRILSGRVKQEFGAAGGIMAGAESGEFRRLMLLGTATMRMAESLLTALLALRVTL